MVASDDGRCGFRASVSFLLSVVQCLLGGSNQHLIAFQFIRELWYGVGLILVPGRRTTTRLERLLPGCPTNRFRISRAIDDRKLRARVLLGILGRKRLYRALDRKKRRRVSILLDTTNLRRFGPNMEGTFKFKDDTTGGAYILGHRVVVCVAVVGRTVIPLGCRLFIRKADAKPLGVEYKSQVQLAEDLIREAPASSREITSRHTSIGPAPDTFLARVLLKEPLPAPS